MNHEIKTKDFILGGLAPVTAHYRVGLAKEGSSDEHALEEVLVKKVYRRVRHGFDVLPGERWLDLGANIGSFALYCKQRGAEAVCFEPDPECFQFLARNAEGFSLRNAAVTASKAKEVRFFTSPNPDNFYRGTVVDQPPLRYTEKQGVNNFYAGNLKNEFGSFDGIKMDIEGSEGTIIDNWLLPPCNKLVMEYHTSRDSSVARLESRLTILRSHFTNVHHPADYSRAIVGGQTEYRPRFDQLIFCWGPKGAT